MEMELNCKYCNQIENKQDKPALKCLTCKRLVHLTCLKRQGTPGDFAGDVFFDFTCCECSPTNEECFERNKMPWVNAILLTFHHLNIQAFGISHHGFFHYKTHIASFIDRNWQLLFGNHKQKKNWMGTIAGTLSVYNGLIFRSGSIVLGETGWWKLQHNFSPAVASHIIVETTKDKPKGRPRNQLALDKSLFYGKVKAMGFMDYIVVENEAPINSPEPAAKKRRLYSDGPLEMSACNEQGAHNVSSDNDPRSEPESMILDESYACLTAKTSYSDVEGLFAGYDFDLQALPQHQSEPTDSCSERTALPHGEDSDSRSSNNPTDTHSDENDERLPTQIDIKPPIDEPVAKTKKAEAVVRRESLFSSQLNSVDLPWVEEEPKRPKDIVELTEYEEIQLLKQVEGLIAKIGDVDKKACLCRLRAKLALRRLKRHKHLPLFDLDKTVKILGGYVTEDPKVAVNAERVLDRFQRSYLMESLSGTISPGWCGAVLVGGGGGAGAGAGALRSAYSAAALKPYIRRDNHTTPLWLALTDQLLRRTNRHIKDYQPPPRATIDYSYVRPQHIAAVNNLCAQFFWPGIDLTEALQHPEFSCVVTYKKLVVGCAFLVPDVRPNEAYISFILTRPEWRNAKIATFMLYHLLQTCTGKDVTLHVSPTNPAIFLYQKFGFKVEELIQDFYEKYYDIDHKGCRHALFLRLVR